MGKVYMYFLRSREAEMPNGKRRHIRNLSTTI
jgi:hypothetical protein